MRFILVIVCLTACASNTLGQSRVAVTLQTTADIAARRAAISNEVVHVLGYTTAGDWGPPKAFRWDPTNTLTANAIRRQSAYTATGRWVHDWDGDVRAFGALGDGASDDTTALIAMRDHGVSSGKKLARFPKGIYQISSLLDFSGGSWTIIGDGVGQSTIRQTTANTSAVRIEGANNWVENINISHSTSPSKTDTHAGLLCENSTRRSVIKKLTVQKFAYTIRATQSGASPSNLSLNNNIEDIQCYDYSRRAFSWEESGTQNTGKNWYFKQSSTNPSISPTGAVVSGNSVTYSFSDDVSGFVFGNILPASGFSPSTYNVTTFVESSTTNTLTVRYESSLGAITTLGSFLYYTPTNIVEPPVYLTATWNLETVNIEWNRATNAIVFANADEPSSVRGLHIEGFIGAGPTNNWVLHNRNGSVFIDGGQFVNNAGYPGTINNILSTSSAEERAPGVGAQASSTVQAATVKAINISTRDFCIATNAVLNFTSPGCELHTLIFSEVQRPTARTVSATPRPQQSPTDSPLYGVKTDTNYWRLPNYTDRIGDALFSRQIAGSYIHGTNVLVYQLSGYGNTGIVAWIGKIDPLRDNSIFSLTADSSGSISSRSNALSLSYASTGKLRLRTQDASGNQYSTESKESNYKPALDGEYVFILLRKNATNVQTWVNNREVLWTTMPTAAWGLETNLNLVVGGKATTSEGLPPVETVRVAFGSTWDNVMGKFPSGEITITEDVSDVVSPSVSNGGFESGSFAPWVAGVSGSTTTSVQNTNVYAGSYAAVINVDGSNSIGGFYITNTLTSGVKYRLKYYAKSPTGSQVQIGDVSTSGELYGKQTLTADWVLYSLIFICGSDNRLRITRSGLSSNANGVILVDDITVTELSDVSPWTVDAGKYGWSAGGLLTSQQVSPPRLTTLARDGLSWSSSDAGAIIYNTTIGKLQVWEGGTNWVSFP